MSDNVAITAGAGTNVATDQLAGGEHVQLMKLVDGAADSSARIGGDATNGLDVDVTRVGGNVTVIQGTAASLKTEPAGNIAHDSVDSGNPHKIGAKAATDLAGATMVSAADRTDLVADLDGSLITKPLAPFGNLLVERLSNTDGASTASTVFGATASARNMITSIVIYNDSTTNAYVDIRDGTSGTIILTLPCPAKGGVVFNPTVPIRQPTANTALAFDASTALTTLYISFVGFKSKA